MWLELFIFALLVLLLRYYFTRPSGMPPGPMVIPYLGNFLRLDIALVKKYRKKYGNIFMTELGPNKFIFLCNYKLIKESMSKVELSDRPQFDLGFILSEGVPAGVIMTNGKHWQNARRFLLRNLRDLGMGKTYLEDAIQREAQLLVEDFKTLSGSPTLFPKSLNVAVLNVVWQMVASTRYDMDDERVLSIIKIIRSFETTSAMLILEFIPFIKKIIPNFIKNRIPIYKQMANLRKEAKKLIQDLMATHRANLDPDNPRDVIDEYLIAMDNKSDIAEYFSELDLVSVTFDLFNAGFDTTSNMLRWIILYMIKYPEVQRRVQEQIDEVVPRDALPSYQHKSNLPLVEAMIQETLRFSSLVALGVQHSPERDIQLEGYHIPKGSFVFPATICCHYDPQYWEHPDQFRLEHFLDEQGNFASQKEGFLPFGTGRRSCLGESLARMELFLFSSALLQNFTFSAPEGCEVNLEEDPRLPSVRMAPDQNIVITPRTKKD
ncbi:cytochrome P450 2L1-like [Portunus trituberculatus]|uniref:cytochrome P450 2L1-like n=1 Tax=Portunus trituberculatus TaxID=210409 RepID=UPI001E1CCC1B|nr:cytochrome P450 2L1-like [Portunus trituberculatus]